MKNDFVRKQYDKVAEEYLKNRDTFKNNKYLDKLLSLIPKGSLILDLGCGAGIPIDSYLIKKGCRVIGIDISEKQIGLAIKNVPQAQYILQDMSQLKEKEYKVDAVVSFYAIFHLDRKTHLDLLKKIYSFIPDNGYILITMGSSDWEGKEVDFFGEEMEWSHYGAEHNIELVKKAGFTIIESEIDASAGERHLVVIAQR